jgi:hypothetical protein
MDSRIAYDAVLFEKKPKKVNASNYLAFFIIILLFDLSSVKIQRKK